MASQEKLIALVNKGFYEENLSDLSAECEELLRRKQNPLVVFTLKGLFRDLLDFYGRPPVRAERATILTAGLQDKVLEILSNIDGATASSLEALVSLYMSNKAAMERRA